MKIYNALVKVNIQSDLQNSNSVLLWYANHFSIKFKGKVCEKLATLIY